MDNKETVVSEEKNGNNNISFAKEVLSLILYLGFVFLLTFLILHFVGQRTTVSGSSMEVTLSDGDNLIMDKLTYRFSDPKRFDIVVFPYRYAEDRYYIKRVIGLPGEKVYIDPEGNIFINDELLKEDYGLAVMEYAGRAAEPIVLGKDEFFVLGDNRNDSEDSRFEDVGNVKKSEIVGRAWVRIYPFNEIQFLKGYVAEK